MSIVVDFFAGYISWNALAWVIISIITIAAGRLMARYTTRDFHETGVLIHGMAAMMAGICLVIGFMAGGIDVNMEPAKWIDHIIAQLTPQSLLINGVVAFVHFLFYYREISEHNAEVEADEEVAAEESEPRTENKTEED